MQKTPCRAQNTVSGSHRVCVGEGLSLLVRLLLPVPVTLVTLPVERGSQGNSVPS